MLFNEDHAYAYLLSIYRGHLVRAVQKHNHGLRQLCAYRARMARAGTALPGDLYVCLPRTAGIVLQACVA